MSYLLIYREAILHMYIFANLQQALIYKYLAILFPIYRELRVTGSTIKSGTICDILLSDGRTHRIIDDRMEKYGSLFVFIPK